MGQIFSLHVRGNIFRVAARSAKTSREMRPRLWRIIRNSGCVLFLSTLLFTAYWSDQNSPNLNVISPAVSRERLDIPPKVLRVVDSIQHAFNFVYLQLVNEAYTEMTLSWTCNVMGIDGVLDRTIFIATDVPTLNILSSRSVKVVLFERQQGRDLSYGQSAYFEFMLFRAKIVEQLLLRGVNVWLVESDAVWFADPAPYLTSLRDKDVVAGQDGKLTDEIPEAGFIFLNSTKRTQRMWSALRQQHERTLRLYADSDRQTLGDEGSEMLMLPQHLRSVAWTFFPKDRFVSGKWYLDRNMRENSFPVVIQNNWIVGNAEKIRRAQDWGHWFLDSSHSCRKSTDTPRIGDTR